MPSSAIVALLAVMLSIARTMNMRVRTLKISAWIALSMHLEGEQRIGMIAMVRAVRTPSATSPP